MGIPFRGPSPSTDDQGGILGTILDWSARLTNGLSAAGVAMAATKTVPGIVQLATAAQAQAATNDTSVMTPAQTLAFLQANQDQVALLTGTRRGTDAQRQALTGAQLIDRLRFYATDNGNTYVYSTGTARWFKENGQCTLTYAGAKTNFSTQVSTQVPFDTLEGNDDSNLYTPTTGANAGITILQAGLYSLSAMTLVGTGTVLGYKGMILRSATTPLREVDYYIAEGRLQASMLFRCAANTQVNAAIYSDNGQTPYYTSSAGSTSCNLQVGRIGD